MQTWQAGGPHHPVLWLQDVFPDKVPASVVKKEDTVTADDAAPATLRMATAEEEEDEAEVSWNPQQVALDVKSDMTSLLAPSWHPADNDEPCAMHVIICNDAPCPCRRPSSDSNTHSHSLLCRTRQTRPSQQHGSAPGAFAVRRERRWSATH